MGLTYEQRGGGFCLEFTSEEVVMLEEKGSVRYFNDGQPGFMACLERGLRLPRAVIFPFQEEDESAPTLVAYIPEDSGAFVAITAEQLTLAPRADQQALDRSLSYLETGVPPYHQARAS